MSTAGAGRVSSVRKLGMTSSMRPNDGMAKPLPNRSNSRSISVRKDRQTSGTAGVGAGAGVVRFTSTGVLAMVASCVDARDDIAGANCNFPLQAALIQVKRRGAAGGGGSDIERGDTCAVCRSVAFQHRRGTISSWRHRDAHDRIIGWAALMFLARGTPHCPKIFSQPLTEPCQLAHHVVELRQVDILRRIQPDAMDVESTLVGVVPIPSHDKLPLPRPDRQAVRPADIDALLPERQVARHAEVLPL